jgi:hypothetical protein
MEASSAARLWLSFWPQQEPAVHRLKLTNLRIHPFGLQFETEQELQPRTPLELRLLLPPMTAIALKGMVTHIESSSHKFLTSIRFTTIRETDRKRLDEFTSKRQTIRLRARCMPSTSAPAATTSS